MMVRNVKLLVAVVLVCLGSISPGRAVTLFSQTPPTLGLLPDGSIVGDSLGSDFAVSLVTYTQISIGSTSTIHDVTWRGLYAIGGLGFGTPPVIDTFRIGVFQDIGGAIGPAIVDVQSINAVNRIDTGIVAFGRPLFEYSFDLNRAVDAGTYWLAIVNSIPANQPEAWTWAGGTVAGHPDRQGNSFGVGNNLFSDSGRYVIIEGDVAGVSVVPLPPAMALFASGLVGLGWFARRRKKSVA